jgi:hypothetical protein
MGINSPGQALDFLKSPAMKALPLFQHFQSPLIRVLDRASHIPVVHLQRDREQRAREVIENRYRILSVHETSLATASRQATDPAVQATRFALSGSRFGRFLLI